MKSNFVIAILVVSAFVLVVAIINPSVLKPSFVEQIGKKQEVVAPKAENEQSTATSASAPKILPSYLTEEEKKLLMAPAPDASREEVEKHLILGQKLAKEASILEVTNCEPKPLVLKVKEKATFKVRNNDSVDHTLIIDQNHKYPIIAKKTTDIKADFGKPTGLYGYVCEGVGLTGFILVE